MAKAELQKPQQPLANVVITGLGGSGIGGTIIADLALRTASLPIVVNKGYHLPNFVNDQTLVIACSYSGNTEETLMALEAAQKKNATIACISSGGKLKEEAKKLDYNLLVMPGGNPPRSMIGYSLPYLVAMLEFYQVASLQGESAIKAAVELLEKESDSIKEEAEKLAQELSGKTTALYAASGFLGVAARWRQQLNENSKMLAWEGEVPEMNHNELVGWEGGSDRYAAVFLRNSSDYDRNQKRIEINKNIIQSKTSHVYEVWSKGQSPLEQALYLIHFGDWVSFYLSELNQVDIIDIKSIDHLKSELSKLPV